MSASVDTVSVQNRIRFQSSYLDAFEQKMFFEGPALARQLSNFYALLLLAAAIATVGVLSDSTATVIGAMIVAPLMKPIMAATAAVILGNGKRLGVSLLITLSGIVAVIVFSWLLAFLIPDSSISFTENGEITSRIAPGLLALLSALASGAAGAFILSREEIADSMGGVAIAISLVPPLCVVGIGLNQGDWSAAWGALLLFLTNFVAILFAGGLTFLVLGLGGVVDRAEERRTRRRATALIVVATIIVAIPLTITTWNAVINDRETLMATETVREWLTGSTHQVVTVNVRDRTVVANVEGQGDLPSVARLADLLADSFGHSVVAIVRAVPSEVASSDD